MMSLDEEMLRQLMASFREELSERLAAINAGLLALEQDLPDEHQAKILEELFRHVHSLKGAARAVSLKPVEELTHGMEDVFGAAKRGSIYLSADLFDLLYQGLDLIGQAMASLEAGQALDPALDLPAYLVHLAQAWRTQPVTPPLIEEPHEPAPQEAPLPARPQPPPKPAPARPTPPPEPLIQPWAGETIRVPTARLDDLMAETGELLVTRLRVALQVEELQSLLDAIAQWQRAWQRVRADVARFAEQHGSNGAAPILAFLQHNEDHLRSFAARLAAHARRVSDDAARLSLVTDRLQEGVKQARMLPLATLLSPFRRMVRDLAREKGVEVSFEVAGAETEMDKHILEEIKDPLMHLLRNCIDHGIEPPPLRLQRGKPRRGTISLRADRQANDILIEVSDDGNGVDIDAVRNAAVRKGFLSPEAAAELSDHQALPLIFSPGLSTASIITEVSGRGVGLDVVRRNVEQLQGHVAVSSSRAQGTSFSLTLPLTLVSTRCLVVQAADHTFAVPLSAVERLVDVARTDVRSIEGQQAIRYLGKPLALVRLANVLDLSSPGRPLSDLDPLPALILSAGGQRIAFLVDELLDEQEVVVKSLGKQLARVPNVAGSTVLGTGEVILILNVSDLVKRAQRTARQQPILAAELAQEPGPARQIILIVDDSITTRTLEKNILTTAGYEVLLATDGEEALAALAEKDCDLIVSDIDMPRVDGFELTSRLKQDERYRELPVILVTSMGSAEDKARGIAVGADAYIVKGTFDQDVLLETIEQLI